MPYSCSWDEYMKYGHQITLEIWSSGQRPYTEAKYGPIGWKALTKLQGKKVRKCKIMAIFHSFSVTMVTK